MRGLSGRPRTPSVSKKINIYEKILKIDFRGTSVKCAACGVLACFCNGGKFCARVDNFPDHCNYYAHPNSHWQNGYNIYTIRINMIYNILSGIFFHLNNNLVATAWDIICLIRLQLIYSSPQPHGATAVRSFLSVIWAFKNIETPFLCYKKIRGVGIKTIMYCDTGDRWCKIFLGVLRKL